jgi:hypothetical protein
MKRSGTADLPLHGGHVPKWLANRMQKLGGGIVEAILIEYGHSEVLRRLSDPAWFQALGSVMGMDWHSSGITTSVMGALKKAVNPKAHELGIYICGGRGQHSRKTPEELYRLADQTGIDGHSLARSSKLSAKIDNTALQDGFQLYLHSFIVTDKGEWAVVQQGMNNHNGMARRYHWHSQEVTSFVGEPHNFIYGQNQGQILNLTDKNASPTREGLLKLTEEEPKHLLPEIKRITMPHHHDVRQKDVNLKRLGAVLSTAHDSRLRDFQSLLMLNGVGPRTLQSLTMVSEVIHGTPSRFSDPARFSFAHGGKDGHPHPVPTTTYDETISQLHDSIKRAKIGQTDKQKALKSLHKTAKQLEQKFQPAKQGFEKYVEKEKRESWQYSGRTVFGKEHPPGKDNNSSQLRLF